ncbi:MAG: biotin transporter BioY [Puniceicoccales bacterium]|nr:biotin transporter BioY [Puniceicoccales bacterium]
MDIKNTVEVQPLGGTPSPSLPMPQWLKLAYGVFFLTLMAQMTIPLPWTPVPITGQTFGTACVALTMGSLATPTVAIYWLLGLCGLPVLAGAASGVLWGPKSGYLLGMVLATDVVRRLKARGLTRTWWSYFYILCAGGLIIYALGLLFLSFFVPHGKLLMAGLWPFIPGDILKMLAATTVSFHWNRYVASKH